MLDKKWILKPEPSVEDINNLKASLNIHTSLCSLLVQRGIKTFDEAKRFFRPDKNLIHDPFLMKGMVEAVDRIGKAFENGERIMIYGDYDVDGTTSVAMVYSFFLNLYDNLVYYIPDRYEEGYGVSFKSINHAKEEGITLIIALDCGIKAVKKVEYAKEKGIDYIICDHHLPGDTVPNGIILNPKQTDCNYPFKELSGAGVGFKLLQGFCKKNNIDIQKANEYLDLLAISIGADMVPIQNENRVLAQYGMEKLNAQPTLGVKAILNHAKIDRTVNMRDIGFAIGPRINAAGRIAHASKAVELLITADFADAEEGSEDVSLDNAERKILDAKTTKEALSFLHSDDAHQNKKSTLIFSEHWHKGILGIVCNRIQEHYYRPTIVLSKSGKFYTGSARSVKGYNLYNAINNCSDILESFGGHAFAAGLTIKPENLEAFAKQFEKIVNDTISDDLLIPTVEVDLNLPLNEVQEGFFKVLNQFEPFGVGNDQPVFRCDQVKALPGLRVVGKNHLKMDIVDAENPSIRIPAIAFNQIKHLDHISRGKPFKVCYSLEINEWKGRKTLQANIRDIKI
ncbi:MAG: single-stranded-DNA-specific exonuclease RecJ [Flavobacteriales bacterium]|nr:single-stranded-DNA-specific exonuclease RecJ [Flavobacteriales bacterium]